MSAADIGADLAREISRKLKKAGFVRSTRTRVHWECEGAGFRGSSIPCSGWVITEGFTVSRVGCSSTVHVGWQTAHDPRDRFSNYSSSVFISQAAKDTLREIMQWLRDNGYNIAGAATVTR